jgi:hypothetical protein
MQMDMSLPMSIPSNILDLPLDFFANSPAGGEDRDGCEDKSHDGEDAAMSRYSRRGKGVSSLQVSGVGSGIRCQDQILLVRQRVRRAK